MIFDIQEQEQGMYATVSGRLDTPSAVKAQQEITPLIANANKVITLDCKDLEYISSSGLRFFMQLKKNSELNGGTVTIRNLNEDVEDIFRLSGFHHIFNI